MKKKSLIKKLEESPHGIMIHTQYGADKFLFFQNK